MRVLTDVLPPPCSTSFGSRAEQSRRVDAERQHLTDTDRGKFFDRLASVRVVPPALHGIPGSSFGPYIGQAASEWNYSAPPMIGGAGH